MVLSSVTVNMNVVVSQQHTVKISRIVTNST